MNGKEIIFTFYYTRIENESSNYRLWVGGYTGNATDSLSAHNGYPFSTVDRNNDEAPKCCPCAPAYGGGWWFYRYALRGAIVLKIPDTDWGP